MARHRAVRAMRHGQVLAGEQLVFRDHPVIALPVVGDEGSAGQADLVDQPAAGRIITLTPVELPLDLTQNPGHGAPDIHVIGAPEPELGRLFSGSAISHPPRSGRTSTVTTDADTFGSGNAAASARTHFSTLGAQGTKRRLRPAHG